MRLGTIGFQGQRLTEAREALGMTSTALADLINVSATTISQYEHNKTSPSIETMEKLSLALNQPRDFFLRTASPLSDDPLFWRSMAAATKSARLRGTRRFTWFREIVGYLDRFMNLPALNLPLLNIPDDVFSLTGDDIEQYALELREFWGLGEDPIADLVLTMENNGILVTRATLDAETLDAFSQYSSSDGRAYIFLGSDKGSAVRSRLDAAHELAHLLLHKNVKQSDINSKHRYKIIESQAFRFASALLLPASSFLRDLWAPSLDAFLSLKQRWRVSSGVMIKRCQELEIMDDDETKRMWINYTRRGYRKKEPFDDAIKVETPRLVRRGFELLVNEGVKTKDQIQLDLPFAPHIMEELAGLVKGFLTGRTLDDEVTPTLRSSADNIIQFQRFT